MHRTVNGEPAICPPSGAQIDQEFKDYIDQGLLALPGPVKDITLKANRKAK